MHFYWIPWKFILKKSVFHFWLFFLFYETLEIRELFKYPWERWEFHSCSIIYSIVYRGVIEKLKPMCVWAPHHLLSGEAAVGHLGPFGCMREGSISHGTPWFDGVLVKGEAWKWRRILRLLWEAGDPCWSLSCCWLGPALSFLGGCWWLCHGPRCVCGNGENVCWWEIQQDPLQIHWLQTH